MAATGDTDRELARHEDTYGFFTGLMKWGTILSAVAAMIVIFIIAN